MTWTIQVCPQHGSLTRAACHARIGGPLCCSYCPPGQEVEVLEVVPKALADGLAEALEPLEHHEDEPGGFVGVRARVVACLVLAAYREHTE